MKLIVVVFVLAQVVFLGSNASPLTLPKPCHKSNPDLNKCLLKFFYKTARILLKGSPEHHILRLDPLEVEVLTINRSLNDFFDVNGVLRNIRMVGLGNLDVPQVKFDPENLQIEAWVTLPNISVAFDYNVTVRIQGDVYNDEGNFKGTLATIVTHINLNLEEVDRDGVKHFGVNTVNADFTVDDGIIKMVTKTKGNQFLADMVTSFFNSNPKRDFEILNPVYAEYLDAGIKSALDRVFEEITVEQLLVE